MLALAVSFFLLSLSLSLYLRSLPLSLSLLSLSLSLSLCPSQAPCLVCEGLQARFRMRSAILQRYTALTSKEIALKALLQIDAASPPPTTPWYARIFVPDTLTKKAVKVWRKMSSIFVLQSPEKVAARDLTKNPPQEPRKGGSSKGVSGEFSVSGSRNKTKGHWAQQHMCNSKAPQPREAWQTPPF